MKFDLRSNVGELVDVLGLTRKQIPYATAVAITRTARLVKDAEVSELRRRLDRPTPYTLNSLFMRGATKARLDAEVWVKDDRATSRAGTPATNFILPNVEGGERRIKRFERVLQITGNMPEGTRSVPGTGARLDAYGNVSRGQITQILSQLRATVLAGSTRNLAIGRDRKSVSARRRAYGRAGGQFIALPQGRGKLPPGIYLAGARDFGAKLGLGRSGKLTAVLLFKKSVRYSARVDFFGVAQRTFGDEYPRQFEAAAVLIKDAFERRSAATGTE